TPRGGGRGPELPPAQGGSSSPRRRPARRGPRAHAGPAVRGGRGPPGRGRLPDRRRDAPHSRPLPRPRPRPRLAGVRLGLGGGIRVPAVTRGTGSANGI